uniref:Uncharacterized protein n=1 Tax=Anguilla anguilla TaxID=7936 RepID=A0A0E9SXH0_ANGAN
MYYGRMWRARGSPSHLRCSLVPEIFGIWYILDFVHTAIATVTGTYAQL